MAVLAKSHLIPTQWDAEYDRLLATLRAANEDIKIVGFAAMPHRLTITPVGTTEPICSPDRYLNHVCYEVGICDLIIAGFLTPVVTKTACKQVDTELLPILGADFYGCAAGELIDQPDLVEATCAEIVASTSDRKVCTDFSRARRISRNPFGRLLSQISWD